MELLGIANRACSICSRPSHHRCFEATSLKRFHECVISCVISLVKICNHQAIEFCSRQALQFRVKRPEHAVLQIVCRIRYLLLRSDFRPLK